MMTLANGIEIMNGYLKKKAFENRRTGNKSVNGEIFDSGAE